MAVRTAAAKLTPKQAAFVRAYLETGNASEAYRRAYDADGMSNNAVHVSASDLLKHPKITLRLTEHQSAAEAKTLMTVELHLTRLAELSRLAQEAGQMSAAITAEIKRGEVLGYYVQRSQNVNHNYVLSDKPMAPDTWAAAYAQSDEQPAPAPAPEMRPADAEQLAAMRTRLAAMKERGDGQPGKA